MTLEKELILKAHSMKAGNEMVLSYRKLRHINLKIKAELGYLTALRTQASYYDHELYASKLTQIHQEIQKGEARIEKLFNQIQKIDEEVMQLLD